MRFSHASALALSFHLSLAHPTLPSLISSPDRAGVARRHVGDIERFQTASARDAVKGTSASKRKAPVEATVEEEEEEEGNELDISGTLDTPLALEGGDIKQDVTFPANSKSSSRPKRAGHSQSARTSARGATSRVYRLEPSSFKVALAEGGDALTLGQIDFIFNISKAALSGVDLTKSRVGKLSTETNTFVVDDTVGEAEFEADENEVVLKVNDLTGEFGIFIPQAAGAGGGNGTGTEDGAAEEEEDDKTGQIEVAGLFGSLNRVDANVFTNLNFAANAAGSLEVEYNGTSANTILVAPKLATVAPPAGHLYVDPLTFTITTETPAQAGDTYKVDYIFTAAMKAAIDPAQGLPGRFDAATQQFVTTGLGEFEFEADENEWSLTVTDLNGEWAYFVPEAAVL